MEKSMGFFHILYIIITIDGIYSMIYKQYVENFPSILTVGQMMTSHQEADGLFLMVKIKGI